jgi:putative membrane protein
MATAEDLKLAKKLKVWAWIITVAVLSLVGLMRQVKIPLPEGVSFSFLPPFYATLNALTAVVLIFAYRFIRQKKVEQHKKAIYLAIALSVGFLLSYVVYHFTTEATLYGGEGFIRTVYFILLITHVILAAAIFPFILFTFIRAYTNQIDQHKKMARWVFPIWLYVAISGPICYLMLLPYY